MPGWRGHARGSSGTVPARRPAYRVGVEKEAMKPIRLKRPMTLFERSWMWFVLGTLLVTGSIAGTLRAFRWISELTESRGSMFALIIGLGLITVLLIGITFFYSLRKRIFQ